MNVGLNSTEELAVPSEVAFWRCEGCFFEEVNCSATMDDFVSEFCSNNSRLVVLLIYDVLGIVPTTVVQLTPSPSNWISSRLLERELETLEREVPSA
jgi:hypothetical protein